MTLHHSGALLLAVFSAGGCGLLNKAPLGRALPGSQSAAPQRAVPKVEVSQDDPPEVKTVINELDYMEAATKGGPELIRFAVVSESIGQRLFYSDEKPLLTTPKLRALRERYVGLSKLMAQNAGGHAPEVMGDGVPPKGKPSGDAEQAAEDAVKACQETETRASYDNHSGKEMGIQYAKFEEKLARAKRVDASALKYRAAAIAVCELKLSAIRSANEDSYQGEAAVGGTESHCGQLQFSARAVMIGGRPGVFERVAGSTTFAQKVDCKKIPTGSKVPKELKQAVDEFLAREDAKQKGTGVVRFDGKYATETDKDDLHVYKYATLTYYDRDMQFSANPCGGADVKVACEASGSKAARTYNEMDFYAARADAHRRAGRADACKRMLQSAFSTYERWSNEYEADKRAGTSVSGLKYKTRRGEVLTDEQIVAKLKSNGKLADEQALGGWCSKS